jgi:hypothetical protein
MIINDDLTWMWKDVVIANIFLEGVRKSSEISRRKASPYRNTRLSEYKGRVLPTQLQCLVQAPVIRHNIIFKQGRKIITTKPSTETYIYIIVQ